MHATVTVFNGMREYRATGKIHKEYSKGLTIEDERGIIHYATFDRVTRLTQPVEPQTTRGDMLW